MITLQCFQNYFTSAFCLLQKHILIFCIHVKCIFTLKKLAIKYLQYICHRLKYTLLYTCRTFPHFISKNNIYLLHVHCFVYTQTHTLFVQNNCPKNCRFMRFLVYKDKSMFLRPIKYLRISYVSYRALHYFWAYFLCI